MLVLDANILIRAVLGSKVLFLLREYSDRVDFLAPDLAFEEAREHLPVILAGRNIAVAPAIETLDLLAGVVRLVEFETYSPYEAIAREHISRRDEDDWPILAAYLTSPGRHHNPSYRYRSHQCFLLDFTPPNQKQRGYSSATTAIQTR